MLQVKFFKATETELTTLEQEINNWLAVNRVKVINMFGNMSPQSESATKSRGLTGSAFAPSDLFLAVLYEKEDL